MPKSTKSKKTKKSQNWFSRLFSENTKNNVPLSKKKDIAKKWCKKNGYFNSGDMGEGEGACVGSRGFSLSNYKFQWKFGFNSIKYNKSSKCNKKWGQGRRRAGCSPKINYNKMKV